MNNNNPWYLLTVFLLTSKAADGIIADLIKNGFGVKPGLEQDKSVFDDGKISSVFVILIQPPEQFQTFIQVRDRISTIIHKNKHFGYTISNSAVSIQSTNIKRIGCNTITNEPTKPIHAIYIRQQIRDHLSATHSRECSDPKLPSTAQRNKLSFRPPHLKLLPPGPLASFIEAVETGKDNDQ
jgi:hypothetical protein